MKKPNRLVKATWPLWSAHRLFAGLLTCVLAAPIASVLADPLTEEWRWIRFGTESGLPSEQVLDMVESTTGTPWVLTTAGLAWYDDFRWVPVRIPDEVVVDVADRIVADASHGIVAILDGRVFHATRDGLVEIPLTGEHFRTARVFSGASLDDGRVLVVTISESTPIEWRGYRVTRTGETEPIELPPRAPDEVFGFHQLTRLPDGTVWLQASHACCMWNDDGWVCRLPHTARVLGMDDTGRIFAAVSDQVPRGIWTWRDRESPQRVPGSENQTFLALAVAPDGLALAFNDSGNAYMYSGERWDVLDKVPRGLIGARRVRFQRNGDLWAVAADGLHLCRRSLDRWERHEFAHVNVNELLRTSSGDLWVAHGAGVSVLRSDGTKEEFLEALGTPLGVITGLAEDAKGAVWISSGATFEGAFRWYRGTWTHYGPEKGLPMARYHRIAKDRQGRLWFLGHRPRKQLIGKPEDPGAFAYDGYRFERWGVPEGLPSGRMYCFRDKPDGSLWFGTLSGLSRWRNGKWTHWTTDNGLATRTVSSLAAGPDGRVWLGHQYGASGLAYVDDSDRVTYLPMPEALTYAGIWDLKFDAEGTLWIATDRGLGRLADGIFSVFDNEMGLTSPRLWPVLPEQKKICVGTLGGGLYVLDASEANDPPPRLTVHAPLVSGDEFLVRWDVHPYRGAIDPARIDTRFRVGDGAWSPWSPKHETRLSGLPYGDHDVVAQAKGLFGNVDPAGARVTVHVPRPLLQTPLAVGVLTLWALSLAGGLIFYVRNKRRQYALLRESEERFQNLLSSLTDVVWSATADRTKLLYINGAVGQILGIPVEEFRTKPGFWFEAVHTDDRERVRQTVDQLLDKGSVEMEYRLVQPDGRIQWVSDRRSVVGRENGRPTRVGGVVTNITERKVAEEHHAQLEEQLRHAQKMEAIGTLATGVAHDFNNVLAAIIGYAGATQRMIPSDHKVQQALDGIKKAAMQGSKVTRSLLTFGRKIETTKSPVNVVVLAVDSASMLKPLLPAGIEFVIEVPDTRDLWIKGDSYQLQQVVVNLVVNARDAMPNGGQVRLRLEARDDTAVIAVEDTGAGMSPRTRERVFEPFFTTKPREKGTGLGMAMVHGIVTEHGGSIEIESTEGEGSRVAMTFPRCPRPAPRDVPEAPPAPVKAGGGTVLVAEDNWHIRQIVAKALDDAGYDVVITSDGIQALAAVQDLRERLGLVVLDLDLPKVSGQFCLDQIRAAGIDVPVIIITGMPEVEDVDVASGPFEILRKPFEMPELLAAVGRQLWATEGSGPSN